MLRSRVLTAFAIACALVLRMAVPSGWMPAASAHGIVLIPCPAASPEPMAHGSHHSDGKKQDHKNSGSDCSFAPFQAGVDVASQATPPTPDLTPEAIAPSAPPSTYLATGPPAPPPPSTGPPSIT